jgi:hypothetical protein
MDGLGILFPEGNHLFNSCQGNFRNTNKSEGFGVPVELIPGNDYSGANSFILSSVKKYAFVE